jgi:hypothetical protein
VAIFHLSAHERVSRSGGQSSLASAAYIMRAQFTDERTGRSYDYRHLDAPQWIGMFSPKDAPAWTRDPANAERFWNALELFEKRKDAQIALPLDIALPHELTLQQKIWLATDYIRENFSKHGYVVLAAIHPPDHDERNIHLHVLVSLRKIDAHGFARTKTEQQDNYRNRDAYIENLREKWEGLANRHLERHGIDARIDRRSLEEQGIEREPQKHRGPTKSAVVFLEQDGAARAAAVAEIARLEAQIIDLDAKRAERETRAGQGEPRAGDIPKAQDMPERTNDNDAYNGATDYIDACSAEFQRQTEAAKGIPDSFRPPTSFNENERQAFKLWLGELEQKMGGPIDIAPEALAVLGRPLEPAGENAHLDEYRPPPAANQNQRAQALFVGSWDTLDPAQLPPLEAPGSAGAEQPNAVLEERHGVPFTPAPLHPGRYDELKQVPAPQAELHSPERDDLMDTIYQIIGFDEIAPAMPEPQQRAPAFGPETIAASDPAMIDRLVEKMQPTDAPEARQTQEASPAPTAPEEAESTTGGPQQAAQEQAMTSDRVEAGASTFFGRTESFVSGFFNGVADYVGGAITYLSDLIAPPPAMPREQIEDAARRVNETEEAAETAAAYRQNHIPGYDPTDHQDSETRQTSERDHDRGREWDLDGD